MMALIITGSVLLIVEKYQFWVFENFNSTKPISLIGQGLEMVISLISLFILGSGVKRIQNCTGDDG